MWQQWRGTSCDNDGLIYSDSKKKADILNNQFSSVFTQEPDDELPDLGVSQHPDIPPLIIQEAGIGKLLLNIKPHKAAGPDNLPAKILKEAAPNLAPALTLGFQASINQTTLPDDCKAANVTPIFIKGDQSKGANCMPVSLTCISYKLMEHM